MKTLLLFHHQGLGDSIICNGMVNEFSKTYDSVTIFCKKIYESTMSEMYCFNPKVKLLTAENDQEAFQFINKNANSFSDIKIIGFNYLNPNSELKFEEQFYEQAGICHSKKWDSFKIGRNFIAEKKIFEKMPEKYVFVHDDIPRQMLISEKYLRDKCCIKADQKITDNMLNFCLSIENAAEIHVIDSCFMFLIDCMKYTNHSQKLFVHRYSRKNDLFLLPVLRKNWTIITEK